MQIKALLRPFYWKVPVDDTTPKEAFQSPRSPEHS